MGKKKDEPKWVYLDKSGKEVMPEDMKEGKVYKLAVRRR